MPSLPKRLLAALLLWTGRVLVRAGYRVLDGHAPAVLTADGEEF